MDVVQRIHIQQLRWLGHIVQIDENILAGQVFDLRRTTMSTLEETGENCFIVRCFQLE